MFGSLPTMKSLTDGSARTTACAYWTNGARSASVVGVFEPLTLWMTTIVRMPSWDAAPAAFCSAVTSAAGGALIPFDHIAVRRTVSNPAFRARSYFALAAPESASLPLSSAAPTSIDGPPANADGASASAASAARTTRPLNTTPPRDHRDDYDQAAKYHSK